MRFAKIFIAALIIMPITSAAAESKNSRAIRAFASYPPLSPGQTEYVVTRGDAVLTISRLYIPSGVTIKVAPDVNSIVWDVKEIVFDQNATIDLSRNQEPPKAGPGAPPPQQAGYCKHAVMPGAAGGRGIPGPSGVSLTLRSVERIRNQGSLWIKTDGGPGGEGGTGGEGQQGGGPRKQFGRGCDGVPGAVGGVGGQGGQGGATSQIAIVTSRRPANRLIAGCSQICNPPSSTRPIGAIGNTGVIAVFGDSGCGGRGGGGGIGGLHGQEQWRSASGPQGAQGGVGQCSAIELWE